MIILNDNLGLLLTLGVLIFLLVIVFLVVMLLYARTKLSPSGPVTISINDDIKLEVDSGSTLLSTLSSEKIFLPSACGGGGTCGMCRCQVVGGGGQILSTEVSFFNRKQIHEHWRLGCQVKVRESLEIKVPKEIFGIKKWECEVISNKSVATYIKEFKVKLPDGESLDFLPGSYIQIDVPKCEVDYKNIELDDIFRDDWNKHSMFDLKMKNSEPIYRAYSMANYPAEGNIIMLDIRIATPPWDHSKNAFQNVNPGICSSYLFSRKPGDKVTISGPYGDFHIKQTNKEMIYIGGGAGMAPLRSQTFHLFNTEKTTRKVSFWYGARSLREIFYEEEFRKIESQYPNFKFNLALSEPLPEDNWKGDVGFIHQVVLDNYLSKHDEPEEIEFYLCGPPVMNDAVFKMLDELGVPKENIAFDDFGI